MMVSASRSSHETPYRPSNGSEGIYFMSRFCDRCQRDAAYRDGTGDSCPIAAATMAFKITDPDYPTEWVQDDSGPRCTAFAEVHHEVEPITPPSGGTP